VAEAIKMSVANSVLLKFNRIGTLSETLDTLAMDRRAGRTVVISHRSGDTSNTDLALGTNAAPIETGSLSRVGAACRR
jgi:enolase